MRGFLDSFKLILDGYRSEIILISISLCIAVASFFIFMKSSNTQTKEPVTPSVEQNTSQNTKKFHSKLVVDISGAVKKPGAYEVPTGARMKDILNMAGGLSDDSDKLFFARNYNLARLLTDQEKIYIPTQEDLENGIFQENKRTLDYTQPTTDLPSTETSYENSQGKININTATNEELDTLPSIGKTTAEKIVKGRPYRSPSELLQKNVVNASSFQQIKDLIAID